MKKVKLNTANPQNLIYKTEEITIAVLGGIKTDGLDRMRVTLKITVHNRKYPLYLDNPELAAGTIRHNIDLYNDTQAEKLVRRIAERLEIGTSITVQALTDLTDQLEQYRLKQFEKKQPEQYKTKKLTEEQEKAAKEYLSKPKLMERTGRDIEGSGVIGEEANRLLMYIIFTSRKTEKPLHVISLGGSGIGKTYLQEKVGELIPEEEKLEITVLSDNAFYYFGQTELHNKLILIEDMDGAENVLYPLRELQSKKKISKTVAHKDTRGNTRTIHLTVEGPVSIAGCTTKESIYEDNSTRSFLIYIDESKEQDEKIMNYQRKLSAGKINTQVERDIKEQFKNMQRLLQPLTVINPYAEQLKIPQEVFKPRRTNAHYLAFIEAVTFYHQYQREVKTDTATGELYIETTLQDIEEANKLMKAILLRKSDELTGAARNYLEQVKAYLQKEKKSIFRTRESREALRMNYSNQKRYMIELLRNNYIKKASGNQIKGYQYEIVSYEEYEQLKKGIDTVLDEILTNLKKETTKSKEMVVRSSKAVQTQNEPPKQQKVRELA